MDVGSQISLIRKRKGLSVRDVSIAVNISPNTIVQIEVGKTNPSLKTLDSLAKTFDVGLADFFTRDTMNGNSKHTTRGNERAIIYKCNSCRYSLLTPNITAGRLFVFAEYEKDCVDTEGLEQCGRLIHAGAIVLKGKLQIQVGGKIYIVNSGDSICFDVESEYLIKNLYNNRTTVVWYCFERS